MSELPSLHEMIAETVNAYLAQTGGGIPNKFIYTINYIDSNNNQCNEINYINKQNPILSSGLNSYLTAVCNAWVQQALFGRDCEDEECE